MPAALAGSLLVASQMAAGTFDAGKFVKRVGERVAEALAKRGVETVEDLLYHLPFRYEDRLQSACRSRS